MENRELRASWHDVPRTNAPLGEADAEDLQEWLSVLAPQRVLPESRDTHRPPLVQRSFSRARRIALVAGVVAAMLGAAALHFAPEAQSRPAHHARVRAALPAPRPPVPVVAEVPIVAPPAIEPVAVAAPAPATVAPTTAALSSPAPRYRLLVSTTPPGADVFIGSRSRGQTPAWVDLGALRRPLEVRIVLAGYAVESTSVQRGSEWTSVGGHEEQVVHAQLISAEAPTTPPPSPSAPALLPEGSAAATP